jgi:hypothetical protein
MGGPCRRGSKFPPRVGEHAVSLEGRAFFAVLYARPCVQREPLGLRSLRILRHCVGVIDVLVGRSTFTAGFTSKPRGVVPTPVPRTPGGSHML